MGGVPALNDYRCGPVSIIRRDEQESSMTAESSSGSSAPGLTEPRRWSSPASSCWSVWRRWLVVPGPSGWCMGASWHLRQRGGPSSSPTLRDQRSVRRWPRTASTSTANPPTFPGGSCCGECSPSTPSSATSATVGCASTLWCGGSGRPGGSWAASVSLRSLPVLPPPVHRRLQPRDTSWDARRSQAPVRVHVEARSKAAATLRENPRYPRPFARASRRVPPHSDILRP